MKLKSVKVLQPMKSVCLVCSSRTLHANLLKEWVSPPEKFQSLMIHCVEEEESDKQYLPQPVPGDLRLEHLTDSQRSQVQDLFTSKLLSEYNGFTNLIEHDIVLKPDAVVKRQSYRIPERLQVTLQEELDLMLRFGILLSLRIVSGVIP